MLFRAVSLWLEVRNRFFYATSLSVACADNAMDYFVSGGATGSLIPHIEQAFGFNYAQVSLLFMCTFLGYGVAAITTGHLSRRVGFGRSIALALIVELAGVSLLLT
jgi:MFS family permease